jgi:DNA replication licensing factor MCM2
MSGRGANTPTHEDEEGVLRQIDEEEDLMGDREAADGDEEEGEDLLGENMMEDYQGNPEEDQYDPTMLDDTEQPATTMAQRMAAERALRNRDRQMGRSPPPGGFPLLSPSPSPARSGEESGGEGQARRKRRRTSTTRAGATPDTPATSAMDGDVDEEDVPESTYDLTHEKLGEGTQVDQRLEAKIKRCFQQFLLKFASEGQEPRYPDQLRKMGEEYQKHLDVSFAHLQAWSPNLALWVSEDPSKILPILNETLLSEAERKFHTYRLIRATDENELRVAVYAFPLSEPIRELSCKHLNKLVNVNGVVTKRGPVNNQVKRLYLRCAKCNYPSGPFDVAEEDKLRPGACIECQSKGPWRVDRQKTLYRNHQKVTLQESPSSVEPGKMPRQKEVILQGDLVDSVRPGDKMELTGIYKCIYDAGTNARTCFPVYRTEIIAVHIKCKGDVKEMTITDDMQTRIRELATQPNIRERFIASMAPSIYGMKHVKTAVALSLMSGQPKIAAGKHRIRGDINTLIVGDPGLAKSQFLKYVEQTFPRAVYTTGKGASAVGLTAAVTRNEFGDFCLEGGAMVLADDGICLIDEFDKMNDQDRTSIHEAMEQQSISISKAGIVASLQARCAVMAVANPLEGRYDAQRTFAQNVNLSDPILSRFDVLCVLRDEADAVKDERLADHVICSHIRSHPEADGDDKQVQPKIQQQASHIEPIDQELLKNYIVFARKHVFPKVTNMDKEKLANFYQLIRAEAFRTGGAPMTARHVESIIRISEAFARIELREHVLPQDLDHAIAVMFESFTQSQKHQVAEELRQKFRRYINHATPASDQVMSLLLKLFRDRTEQLRLGRPGGVAPEISEVAVEMAEIVRQVEKADIEIADVHNFMRSPQFQSHFRVEDERVYQVV